MFRIIGLALLMLAVVAGSVQGGLTTNFVFDGTLIQLNFVNYEVVLRDVGASDQTGAVNSVTIPGGGNFSIIDPFAAGGTAIRPGDLVIQVLHAENFRQTSHSPSLKDPVTGGSLTGYLAAQVSASGSLQPLSTTVDPFGVLGSSEIVNRWYLNDAQVHDHKYANTTETQGEALKRIVEQFASGTELFDFGFGNSIDGSGFSGGEFNVQPVVQNSTITRFDVTAGLNVLDLYGKDDIRFLQTGVIGLAGAPYSLEIEQKVRKPSTALGEVRYNATANTEDTPFYLISWDPVYFAATPEPGSVMAIFGMAGIGLLVAFRRRRK